MSTILTGLNLLPSSGGVPNTMKKFSMVLGAEVISFTDEASFREEGSAFDGIRHVFTVPNNLGRRYAFARRQDLKKAESVVSTADLLTCHVMLRYHALWVKRMAAKYDIPFWFIPHGQLDPYVYTYRSVIKKIWVHLFGKKLLREAAHVIFSTRQEKQKAEWIYSGTNGRVVHWPVDIPQLVDKESAKHFLTQKLSGDGSEKVLLYLGRLHPMKRPLETIMAFCKAKVENSHLLVIGMEQGVTFAQCNSLASDFGMSEKVHVLGPVFGQEKENYILGSDAYISLSERENFGHTAAESLALGIPAILSPGNDLVPDLRPYDCGWFLESNSIDEASEAIVNCLNEPIELSIKRGFRGKSYIEKECSFTKFEKTLNKLRIEAIDCHKIKGR